MVVPTLLSPFLYKSLLANTHGKLNCSTVNAGAGKLIISGRALALELLRDPRCRGVRASVGSRGLRAVGLSDSQSSADPFPEPSPSLCTQLRALGHHSPIPVWTLASSRGLVAVTGEGEAPRHGAWSRRPRSLLGEPPGTKGSECCRENLQKSHWKRSVVWFLDCCLDKYLLVCCDGADHVKQLHLGERGEFSGYCPTLWRIVHCVQRGAASL